MLNDIQKALGYILGYFTIILLILLVIKGIIWAANGIFY